MIGTFGGALEARKINASDGRLSANIRGEIETEEGVLVIRRIHVAMLLQARNEDRGAIERVLGFFADKCPVYRSLRAAIEITSSCEFIQESQ
jgi:uncharacterized OsmC-like protein